jgi:hypothetical protein
MFRDLRQHRPIQDFRITELAHPMQALSLLELIGYMLGRWEAAIAGHKAVHRGQDEYKRKAGQSPMRKSVPAQSGRCGKRATVSTRCSRIKGATIGRSHICRGFASAKTLPIALAPEHDARQTIFTNSKTDKHALANSIFAVTCWVPALP